MEQPEGYDDGSNKVCRLNKAIYGLKQAGRQWNFKLDTALRGFGLAKSKLDPCIYFSGDLCLMIAIYVDDFLLFYKRETELTTVKDLHGTFRMKDLGLAKNCIGIRIKQGDGFIELDQSVYIADILERFGMSGCKPVKAPSDTNEKLSASMTNEENSLVGKVPYQEAVGSLLYLTQATRPDIAFAVNDVSRFKGNHSENHWKAVKRILRYLSGTIDYKLRFSRERSTDLYAYCDSDWASDADKRRSCSGYLMIMSNGAISWCSKRQSIVALSSTEAEYVALSSAVCELVWIKQLTKEINCEMRNPTRILCDNQSAIKLASMDAFRPRTKHIDIRHHHIRERVDEGIINIEYVSTNDMAADSLTKAVTIEKTRACSLKMGLVE